MSTTKDVAEVVEHELPESESAPRSSHCYADLTDREIGILEAAFVELIGAVYDFPLSEAMTDGDSNRLLPMTETERQRYFDGQHAVKEALAELIAPLVASEISRKRRVSA